ncbi:hypothetical protein [Hymenobacter algoricola]|uniref:Outer membrane protein beta-barrel domain-containing protein n=1 Tax=Hymenobacter algoricola TaxID=486267 RepID=A0ABP7NF42_9BACT
MDGGLNGITITRTAGGYTEETNVSISPSALVHLRGGVRWQLSNIALLGTLGYGVVADGGRYTYHSHVPPSAALQDVVRLFGPGGVEVSFGFSVGLGR